MSNSSYRAYLGGLIYLSAILCTIGLGRPSFWIDEAHSYEFAALASPWLVVLNAAARDAYPPLYFLLLHGWMALFSDETWLRLLSVLLHLASLPLIYFLGWRLLGRPAGLIAAALLALSPFHLSFAREARMYSLLAFLALASQLGMLMWIQDKSRKAFALFVAAGLALLYTHFIGALLLAAQALILVSCCWTDRTLKRGTWKWMLILALGFLPWSPFFLKAFMVTRGYGAEAAPHRLVFYFLGAVGNGFGSACWLQVLSALAVVFLAGLGLASVPGGLRRRFLLIWALTPLVLELAATYLGKPVFGERTLITSTPAWILLFAAALTPFRKRSPVPAKTGAVVLGALAGLAYAHLLVFGMREAPAHREALNLVVKSARPGDAIVHSSFVTYHPVHRYYLPRLGTASVADFLIEPDEAFPEGKLGGWFRERWRSLRRRLDPAGAIRTGKDPSRLSAREFASNNFRRVWYFRTDRDGARRLWYLAPSVYYEPAPDKVRVTLFKELEAASRGFVLERSEKYPGLALELYRRR